MPRTFVNSPMDFRFVLLLLFLVLLPVQAKEKKRDDRAVLQEEQQDYYKKWLKEDIVYIITDEELDVFNGLGTMEEKEQFIEQFWRRRDPDLRTAINEYKEEHYRRIAYANERFPSGKPGWMTDRGRIYIIHGPPDQITSRAGGGFYARPMHEGGGVTSTYPFETWRYRWIEGLGQEIELEFVDPSLSGEYRLSLDPAEKDALLYLPGGGLTLAEEMGLAEKKDRPFFSPGMRDSFPYMATRAQDDVFERYERYVMIKAPKKIKYGDLKGLVDVSIGYESLPFRVRRDYFKLGDDRVVVPVTVELDNGELSFKLEKNQRYVAKVGVYGAVTSMTRQVVDEFDYDLVQTYHPEAYAAQAQKQGRSTYQKILVLDRKLRYRLDLVVKDLSSGKVGVSRTAIVPPAFGGEKLKASSMILTDLVRQIENVPQEEMFILGNVKVRPVLDHRFAASSPLAVYLQVYNVHADQATMVPSIQASFRISAGKDVLMEEVDESGESIQYFSGQRMVLIKSLPIQQLKPGRYSLNVKVHDKISDQEVSAGQVFQVRAPSAADGLNKTASLQ